MAPNSFVPRIVDLATTISGSVMRLHEVLCAQNAPSPSFHEDAPAYFPKEASDARDKILDATAELYDLLLEPLTLIYKHHAASLEVCYLVIYSS